MSDEYLSEAFIKSLHAQVIRMEGSLQENAAATTRNAEAIEGVRANTQDIVDMFRALDGGFKVLQGLGKLARPIGYIATAIAAAVAAVAAVKGFWK